MIEKNIVSDSFHFLLCLYLEKILDEIRNEHHK